MLPVVVAFAGHLILVGWAQWEVAPFARLAENPLDYVELLAIECNQYCEVEQVIVSIALRLGETEVLDRALKVCFYLLDL